MLKMVLQKYKLIINISKGNIALFVKSTILEWAGRVWRSKNSIMKSILVNNINRKISRIATMVGCS